MLMDLLCLFIIFVIGLLFFGSFYLANRHCKKLGVSFRDFYFGTEAYDKALAKYNKQKK
jgi:hypothetical protein